MIWLYDRAICEDLESSFNSTGNETPAVRVIDPEGAITLQAQVSNDEITYPVVALVRQDSQIDRTRLNFTRLHTGVDYVFESDENNMYSERCMPITLSYELHIITTNTVDMDELIRELSFKYSSMYFLTIRLPYEGNRKIRFGVCIDEDSNIERSSGTYEHMSTGKLYESIIHLRCEGCVMVTYVASRIKNTIHEVVPVIK